MKALIWIVILALIAWGIWWFMDRDPADGLDDQGAAAGQTVEVGSDADVDASLNPTDDPEMFDDKG